MAAAIPAIASAVITGGLQYSQSREQRRREAGQQMAEQNERAAAAAIQEEAQGRISEAVQGQQQQARAAYEQRLGNRANLVRQELGRQNLLGSPAGQSRLTEIDREGIRGADRLSTELASAGERSRTRALYEVPRLLERQTSLAGRPSAREQTLDQAATFAAGEFGRELSGEGGLFSRAGRLFRTPGINPNARGSAAGGTVKVRS